MRYCIKICYDGSKFEGFQRLVNGRGVQNELERVLTILAKKKVVVKGAGRTDRNVHALGQYIHFDMDLEMEEDRLCYVMNRLLCPYVSVLSVKKVDESFHARYDVKEKTYVYKIYMGEKNPFLEDYTYPCYIPLDLEKMKECARCFLGVHDFHYFVSGERKQYQSEIYSIQITQQDKIWTIEIKGKSFYRYMVRGLVGALVDVASGKRKIQEVQDALNLKCSRRFSVLPANGLYLMDIQY